MRVRLLGGEIIKKKKIDKLKINTFLGGIKKMRSKRQFIFAIGVLITFISLSACTGTVPAPTTTTAPEKVYTAIFTTDSTPESEPWLNFHKPMFDEMEQATGGRFKIDPYLSGSLYKDMETVNVIPQGLAQIAQINQSFWKSIIPELNMMDMVGYFDSPDHWSRWYKNFEKDFINQLYKKHNTMLLSSRWVAPTTPFYTKAKIKSLIEAKNMKTNCFGPDFTALANAMGLSPVSLGIMEVYEGLERGILDATYAAPLMVEHLKWYEQLNSMWYGITSCGNTHTVVNLEWFNSLPPDMQKKLVDIGTKWEEKGKDQLLSNDAAAVSKWKDMGKLVWEPTPQEVKQIRENVQKLTKDFLVKESLGQETFDLYLSWVEKTR
jgi:TRAP-type transport system periplasmic protein